MPCSRPRFDVHLYKRPTYLNVLQYLTHHGYTQWTSYQPDRLAGPPPGDLNRGLTWSMALVLAVIGLVGAPVATVLAVWARR